MWKSFNVHVLFICKLGSWLAAEGHILPLPAQNLRGELISLVLSISFFCWHGDTLQNSVFLTVLLVPFAFLNLRQIFLDVKVASINFVDNFMSLWKTLEFLSYSFHSHNGAVRGNCHFLLLCPPSNSATEKWKGMCNWYLDYSICSGVTKFCFSQGF